MATPLVAATLSSPPLSPGALHGRGTNFSIYAGLGQHRVVLDCTFNGLVLQANNKTEIIGLLTRTDSRGQFSAKSPSVASVI